jgi:hypothetical protein
MKTFRLFIGILIGIFLISSFVCTNKPADNEQEGISEGDEAGPRLTVDDTYSTERNGIQLNLAYDSESSSFIGTVENITKETIQSVRVEVHLSNGMELGPTKPVDLESGDIVKVKLPAEGQSFKWWKAHPEAGEGEHEHEHDEHGDHKHEHDEDHEHGEHKHEHDEDHEHGEHKHTHDEKHEHGKDH